MQFHYIFFFSFHFPILLHLTVLFSLRVQNEKLRRRKRLDRRKILISKRLLFGDTGRTGFPSETLSGESVWIDSSILRRFLSCDDSLEEIFQNANVASILNNKSYLCTHSNGLNPNVACRGKLIPLEIYQAVKEIIEEEYDTFLRYESDGNKTHSINGARNKPLQEYVFNKDSNLRCKKCGLSHQSEMREKLKCLEVCANSTHPIFSFRLLFKHLLDL